ncbi:tetratricopeptide repeat protein [Candidatus Uabimicrobium amorphum]|uniref:Tetratricopeptide repeat protein n=1 Tax=Uabimicrobium amorphum TaxID=2596890 RepID=A0A5S9ITZ3_UABAM|nr:hypothetical protein [Candidatus Uabimicrobium amorphum]BBM87531.1 hypothetical protein UABAM_05943 [Candidatus Uabimicrobium amorphum]
MGFVLGFGPQEFYIRSAYFAQKFSLDIKTSPQGHNYCHHIISILEQHKNSPRKAQQRILSLKYCSAYQKKITVMRWGEYLYHSNHHQLLQQLIKHISKEWGKATSEYFYLQSLVANDHNKWLYLQQLHKKFPHHICSEKSLKAYLLLKHQQKNGLTHLELDRLIAKFIHNKEYKEALAILNANTAEHIYFRIIVHDKQHKYKALIQNAQVYLGNFPRAKHRDQVLWKLAYTLSHRLQECKEALTYYNNYISEFPKGKYIANVLISKGDSLVCIGESDAAMQTYLQVASATDKEHLLHIAFYSAANILLKNNDPQAVIVLKKALQYRGPYTQKIQQKLKSMQNE